MYGSVIQAQMITVKKAVCLLIWEKVPSSYPGRRSTHKQSQETHGDACHGKIKPDLQKADCFCSHHPKCILRHGGNSHNLWSTHNTMLNFHVSLEGLFVRLLYTFRSLWLFKNPLSINAINILKKIQNSEIQWKKNVCCMLTDPVQFPTVFLYLSWFVNRHTHCWCL